MSIPISTKTLQPGASPMRAAADCFTGEPIGATGLVVYRDVFGGWRWEYHQPDGEVRDSQHGYETRAECLGDAARRGFLPAAGAGPAHNVPARPKPSIRPAVAAARPGSALAAASSAAPGERERSPGLIGARAS